jgi:nucleotide-binding universal stress UspA family protein
MYERILLAVDGGPSSDLAISQAILVAKAMSAEVKAIFVVDDSDLFFESSSHINPNEVLRDLFSVGQQTLSRVAARLQDAGVRCTTAVIERPVSPGQISSTIVSQADMWPADMIVMGTHGRRGVRRMIMGSVSEGVIAKTNKPVLLVRSERDA